MHPLLKHKIILEYDVLQVLSKFIIRHIEKLGKL